MTSTKHIRPAVIGIAGGTGSGKTTVAEFIAERFPEGTVALIGHDSYYHDHSHLSPEERALINYDHPDAFDSDLLVRQLKELMDRRAVERPVYDYVTHSRQPRGILTRPAQIILIEGILVLENKQLRELMDIKLFIDTDNDERFIRRMLRDTHQRGRDLDSVVTQYMNTVKPMHLDFVEPSKRYADVIIPGGAHNSVAMDLVITKIRALLQDMAERDGEAAVPSPS